MLLMFMFGTWCKCNALPLGSTKRASKNIKPDISNIFSLPSKLFATNAPSERWVQDSLSQLHHLMKGFSSNEMGFWLTDFNYRNTGRWHSNDQLQLTISQSLLITRWWAQSDQLAVKGQQCHISSSAAMRHELRCRCKSQKVCHWCSVTA